MRILSAWVLLFAGMVHWAWAEEGKSDAKEYYRKAEEEKKAKELETAITAAKLRVKTEEGKRDQEKKNAQKFVRDLADRYYLRWTLYEARWITDPWGAYDSVRADILRKEKTGKGSAQVDVERYDDAMNEYKKKFDAFEAERATMQQALEKAQQQAGVAPAQPAWPVQRPLQQPPQPQGPPNGGPPPEAMAPPPQAPAQPAAQPAPVEAKPADAEAPPKKKNIKIFVLTDGSKIESSMAMDTGEAWTVKDLKGKMHTIAKDKIEKIEEPE